VSRTLETPLISAATRNSKLDDVLLPHFPLIPKPKMPSFTLNLKHAGKTYSLPDFDPSAPASVFKDQIYRLTGVPADKVKVPVKGGMLKDDADLSKLGFKEVRRSSTALTRRC
jgi:hypothetical protein